MPSDAMHLADETFEKLSFFQTLKGESRQLNSELFGDYAYDLELLRKNDTADLWHNRLLAQPNEASRLAFLGSGEAWLFWFRWYEGFLNGEPLDWELQKRVAQIPDDIWEAGVEAIAAAIEEIEHTYLLETTAAVEDPNHVGEESARYDGSLPKLILSRTNVVPPLVESPDTQKLTLPKADTEFLDPLDFAMRNIKSALVYALENCAENGFSGATDEASVLRFALEGLPKEARYVAPPFHHAQCMLERKLKNGEYPKDGPLTFLNNQLKAAVVALVEVDPSVKDHIESYGSLPEPEPLSKEIVEEVREASDILEPVVEDDARAVIGAVADRIEVGKTPSKYEWALLAQWLAQIWLYLEKVKKHSGIAEWVWKLLEKLW